jgi:serine/threonine protein kinase
MDYFDGIPLEEHIRQHGPLTVPEFLNVARQMAGALLAAHTHHIWHRDVKPGNVLLKRTTNGFQVKLIDFGLAFRPQAVQNTLSNADALHKTTLGQSIAGTIEFAALEQMGRLPGVAIGPYSDVYGFGRTSCYMLFGTPHPGLKHWKQLTEEWLTTLLDDCTALLPGDRPPDFLQVLQRLATNPAVLPAPATRAINPSAIPALTTSTVSQADQKQGHQDFTEPFTLPSGRVCLNIDELALGCQEN